MSNSEKDLFEYYFDMCLEGLVYDIPDSTMLNTLDKRKIINGAIELAEEAVKVIRAHKPNVPGMKVV